MIVTFIGFGAFGQAVASVIKKNKEAEVRAWDVVDTGDSCQIKDVKEAVKGADLIIFGVPSKYFAKSLEGMEGIEKTAVLMSGTKGIDSVSGKLPVEMLREAFPDNKIAVISGPMLAEELQKGIETCATVATKDRSTFAVVAKAFEGTILRVCYSKDLMGVSLAGVLKNVYTLTFGLCAGLKLGSNFKACVVLQALKEIQAITQVLGGDAATMMTHAGIGDLLATGYSDSSRNFQYGLAIGAGKKTEGGATVEGIENIETVLKKLPDKKSFPLICAGEDIFLKGVSAKETLLSALKSC